MLARIPKQQKTKREKKVIMQGTMHRTQTPINLVRGIGRIRQNGEIMKWQVFKNKGGKLQVVEVTENRVIPNFVTVKLFDESQQADQYVKARSNHYMNKVFKEANKNVAISH